MKKLTFGLLSAVILVLAGCSKDDLIKEMIQGTINEQPKDEVLAKKYLVVLQNMNDVGCNDLSVGIVASHLSLLENNNTVVYASDPNPSSTCNDFNMSNNRKCFIQDASDKLPNGEDISKYAGNAKSCLIASDKFNVGQAESLQDVVTKPKSGNTRYILLVSNIDPELCGGPIIFPLSEDEGYKNVSFFGTEETMSCDDRSLQGDGSFTVKCDEYDIRDHTDDYDAEGNASCVVGTDTKPEK